MYIKSLEPPGDSTSQYVGHAAIIQSSGSGKSRLVDEVAKDIFTVPFNIRDVDDSAYPPADDAVHDLLVSWANQAKGSALLRRLHGFLLAVFTETAVELNTSSLEASPQDSFAGRWRQYLDHNGRANRAKLYKRIIQRAVSPLLYKALLNDNPHGAQMAKATEIHGREIEIERAVRYYFDL
ncbi:hypothetical protein C8Q76DRAFT_337368 [Earliella scabrosa]|nr:hypothetical protein C8Q76DRAFT_337368 [Earliella scabrosa]